MNWLFTAINIIAICMLGYVIYQQNIELSFYDSLNEEAPVVIEQPADEKSKEEVTTSDSSTTKEATETVSEAPKEEVKEDSTATTPVASSEEEPAEVPSMDTSVEADDEIIRAEDEDE